MIKEEVIEPKPTVSTTAEASLFINGKSSQDNIQTIVRGAKLDIGWTASGVSWCQIEGRVIPIDEGTTITTHAYYSLPTSGQIVSTADKTGYIESLWKYPSWLIFYLDCNDGPVDYLVPGYKHGRASDIVSIVLESVETKKNLTINEPTNSILYVGEKVQITWSADPKSVPIIDITLTNKNYEPIDFQEIASGIKNNYNYSWTIPNDLQLGIYRIIVSEPSGGSERAYDETNLFEIRRR
ncbi:MAG TPA: hypothetical protein PKA60_01225 [Candidatus Paceibacterota bacterium]|nr:hypothetical protein [Candidatus Paceibacterota bacterium]